ncbi:7-cyano-7-deazaguanine synthase QueC, partial [bacterium]|nr:7-cyano-7-deazaguanine synthase QueC [bacterium]
RGDEVFPLTIRYGQRHEIEIEQARRQLKKYELLENAREIVLDLSFLSVTSLINKNRAIPVEESESIPSTYVPSRNIIFLSIASAWAEQVGADLIAIGVNSVDYSGYPDCRPEFIESFNRSLILGTKRGVEGKLSIEAPLQHLTKGEIIKLGLKNGVDYGLTHSCYNPTDGGVSCGICDSCRLRLEGFREAGISDPLSYTVQN